MVNAAGAVGTCVSPPPSAACARRRGESRSEVVLQLAELLLELGQRGMLGRLLLEQLELPALRLEVARGLLGSDVDAELDAVKTLLDRGRELVCALRPDRDRQQNRRGEGDQPQSHAGRKAPFDLHQSSFRALVGRVPLG